MWFKYTMKRLTPTPSSIAILLVVFTGGCASSTQRTETVAGQVLTLREEYTNIHAIKTGEQWLLIDSGFEESAAELEARLVELEIEPSLVKTIILTHGHADHAGGAQYFREVHGTNIIAARVEREMLAKGRNDRLCPVGRSAERRLEEYQEDRYRPLVADMWIDAITDLRPLVGVTGNLVPMPGHTEGSMVVIIGDAAFVGDLFRGAVMGSSAETQYFMCDLEDNRRDIHRLLSDYPEVQLFFTGHFGPVSRASVEEYLAESV